MSRCREAVEWGFGEIVTLFPFLDFSKNLKTLLQPVGVYYLVGVLLCNAHTCMHVPKIPQYFDCMPPTIEEYFRGEPADGPLSLTDLLRVRPWHCIGDVDDDEGNGDIDCDTTDEE
jgi:hypothetical protein